MFLGVDVLRILVDAMGGDYAPDAIVNGCIDAIKCQEGFDILLIGDSEKIRKIINKRKFHNPRLEVVHAMEIITNEDMPTKAIKSKKKSSMVVGFNMLKEKKGDAFISAGNSGALLTGALLILGRLKGVDRPALGAIIPTKSGKALLIDAGLNSACKPINYLQFAIFGHIYMQELFQLKNPRIGLINMGTEARKGTEVLKHAYKLLSKSKLNFVGNVEGKDLPKGKVDVAVCDGYVGNVLLKFLEGTGSYMFAFLKGIFKKTIFSKLSFLFVMKDMKEFKKILDPEESGGAPILGINGVVIKSHGCSNAKTIKNVILKAYILVKNRVFEKTKETLDTLGGEVFE
jgi:glycerol-3-phosphate acyltransferase PlsX